MNNPVPDAVEIQQRGSVALNPNQLIELLTSSTPGTEYSVTIFSQNIYMVTVILAPQITLGLIKKT